MKSNIYGSVEGILAYIDVASSDTGMGSSALAYAKQASLSSSICIDGKSISVNHIYDAVIPPNIPANFNAIIIQLTSEDRQFLGVDVRSKETHTVIGTVTFKIDERYFARLHKAVERLPHTALRKILPNREVFNKRKYEILPEKIEWPLYKQDNRSENEKRTLELDHEQFKALTMMMNSNAALPFIILGPFGTGKTRLLARTAYNMVCGDRNTRNKVLLVAHHQSSADTLINIFSDLGNCRINVVRVCKVNDYRSEQNEGIDYIPINDIRDGGNDLDGYDIVVTTLGTSHSLFFKVKEYKRSGYFTHIFIDEGAQTREPEAIIPLCFAGENTKIVIAGDHCQVTIVDQGLTNYMVKKANLCCIAQNML